MADHLSSVVLIAQILIIVTGAGVYSWLMTTSGIPQSLIGTVDRDEFAELGDAAVRQCRALGRRQLPRTAGRDSDPHPAVVAGRRSQPASTRMHFGIIMAVNLSIGLYMPPFGLNLFAARAIFNVPMGAIYRGVLPFVVLNFLALLVITYVPAISTVLIGGGH